MASSKHASGRSLGVHQVGRNAAEEVGEAEEEKLAEPCFESYLRGAWWEVEIVEHRSDNLLVKYIHLKDEDAAWISFSHLRLRARRCDDWDCYILRRGVDVSVYAVHPLAVASLRNKKAFYDAKIVGVSKAKHKEDCFCKFTLQFFSIIDDSMSESPVARRPLANCQVTQEVKIGRLSILQQPGITPLHEVLLAHRTRQWKVDQGRWSNDAYFLKETELRVFRSIGGLEGISGSDDTRPPNVASYDVPVPKAGRSDANNGQFRAGEVPGKSSQDVAKAGSRNNVGRSEVFFHPKKGHGLERREKNSAVTQPERKLKRKQPSLDEETSNLVQEDHTSTRSTRFTRSHGKVGGEAALGIKTDRRLHKAGKVGPNGKSENAVQNNRGTKPQRGTDSSDEDNVSESSQQTERPGHSDYKTQNQGLVDVHLKQDRTDLLKSKKHQLDGTCKQSLQRAFDQVRQNGSYHGTGKAGKTSSPVAPGNKLTTPHSIEVGNGRWTSQDLKQEIVEINSMERAGKKRWHESDQPEVKDATEWNGDGGSKNKNDCRGKSKRKIETINLGNPAFVVSSSTEKATCNEKRVETDPGHEKNKMVRIQTNGEDGAATAWPKDRQQQGSPAEGLTSSKGHLKNHCKGVHDPDLITIDPDRSHEEVHNDPVVIKRDVVSATTDAKLKDPRLDPSHQLRKLRPRRPDKKVKKASLKSSTHSSSKASKLPSTSLPKVSKKDKVATEKVVTEKVVDRPLYMDLSENNFNDECDAKNLGEVSLHADVPKANLGLNPTWNPVGEEMPSDSECNVLSNDDPLTQMVWQDFESGGMTPGIKESRLAPVHESDECTSTGDKAEDLCQHKSFLKDDVGLVCEICGIILTPIDEVMPDVDFSQRRHRQEDVDDWDKDFAFPQSTFEYKNLGIGKETSMLNSCLPQHYANAMHPHQKEGFEFLWKHLAFGEGNERRRKVDNNSGCILSHAPGTGKSFLVISFLKSYMDKFLHCRPLIVAPKIMLREWEKEFYHWKSDIKVFILNTAAVTGKRLLQKHEESRIINLKNYSMTARGSVDAYRMALLHEWRAKRSVCLVSYNLFSSLIDEEGPHQSPDGDAVRRSLLESPGILILDEGHFPRNKDTRVRKALMRVKTNARILLSGTLFQNNFEELFNTLYLVRPGFVERFSSCNSRGILGGSLQNEDVSDSNALDMEEVAGAAEKKARKLFVEEIGMQIEQGQLSKGSEVLKNGLERLQKITANFVHIHTGEVLSSLPGLRDFGILLKPSGLQSHMLGWVDKRFQKPEEYLKKEIAVSETSIHPILLERLDFIKNEREASPSNSTVPQSEPLPACNLVEPEGGVKTKFVFDLLRSLETSREKVLIFSQHISPLDLLEEMFKSVFHWDKRKDILRLDGKLPIDERKEVIEKFNDAHSAARVLLASTKACGEGITLVGASRVVFLDVLWNPAVIKQAVSRAFRLGQKKTVYVYRLIALGTIEEKKYKKAIRKDWLSQAIFGQTGETGEHPPKEMNGKFAPSTDEILAWEVDANTCEDYQLEKLLTTDKAQSNSFSKVIEHGSAFHNRQTPCGPDARDWFLEDWDDKELSQLKSETDEPMAGFNVAAKIYQDFGELGAFGGGDAGTSSDTDEEDL